MHSLPPLDKLINELTKLPGIGEKSATRLAYFLIRAPHALVQNLSASLLDVKNKIKFCKNCFYLTDMEICSICADPKRKQDMLCVIESPQHVFAIEKSRRYTGLYHVLHGALSPLDGIGPDDLKIHELITRVKENAITEIILANNASVEGEATAHYIATLFKNSPVKISRLALGIPMGGDLEYIDYVTVAKALEHRIAF